MSSQLVEKQKFRIDLFLTTLLLCFMALSLVSIFYASEYVYFSTKDLVVKQFMWYVIGFGVVLSLVWLGNESWFKLIRILYFILLGMLFGLVAVKYIGFLGSLPGISNMIFPINGAYAWYHFPGLGSFQPSEFMKIVMVFISADIIEQHNLQKQDNSLVSDLQLFIKIGVWALPPLFLTVLQPDTGIPMIAVFSLIALMYTAGTQRFWFMILFVILITLYLGTIYIYYNHPQILSNLMGGSYRLGRFYGWLDYQKYAQHYGYQLNNSLINLGIGGLTGVGDIPLRMHTSEGQTDFIFTIIGSRYGFLGTLSTIVLCILLNARLIYLTVKSHDIKAKYVMSGLIAIFMIQQVINMAMIVGLVPITGITLPLISYGGSSLISYMIGLAYPFILYSQTKNNPVYE